MESQKYEDLEKLRYVVLVLEKKETLWTEDQIRTRGHPVSRAGRGAYYDKGPRVTIPEV